MSTQPAPAPTMCASHELTWGAREKDAPATPSLGVRTAHRRMPSGYPNIRGTHAARCRTITKRLPHKEGSLGRGLPKRTKQDGCSQENPRGRDDSKRGHCH